MKITLYPPNGEKQEFFGCTVEHERAPELTFTGLTECWTQIRLTTTLPYTLHHAEPADSAGNAAGTATTQPKPKVRLIQ